MDKAALRQAIVEQLTADLAVLVAAANASKDEATDVESKQEGQYDMRGQSAAYLAAGQARLATELGEAIAAYRNLPLAPVAPGAGAAVGSVVVLASGKQKLLYFLGPARGGIDVSIAGHTVTVVTAASPLGRQLFGSRVGGPVTLPGARNGPVHTVAAID